MIVIADIKRGDIGSTASGYSNAFLGKTPIGEIEESIYDVDYVTLNPYMGIDSIKPFIDDCKKYDKGLFILVKTSNPSSGELQDLKLEDGKTMVNIEGSEKLMEADSVIIAISQNPKNNIVSNTENLDTNKYGLLITDDCGHTTREGVFASGDVVTGAKTVVEAVENAKNVAEAIDEYCKSKNL